MDSVSYVNILCPVFAGRKVIFIGEVAAFFTADAQRVRIMGASDVLVIGVGRRGMGALPSADVARVVVLDHDVASSGNSMDLIRAAERAVAHPSDELLSVLRAFDPGGSAVVLGFFLNTTSFLDGRPFLSYRRPEWVALEDKTVIDAFWDRAGVPRAPAQIVDVDRAPLREASRSLNSGHGTVWSGDTKEGFNGGGEYVRWIRHADDEDDAFEFFHQHCDVVRVMPFLEGIPCSIHGIVFPDFVVALRPVEMVTLRRDGRNRVNGVLAYSGCASVYDPPAAVRESMRKLAKTVGAAFRFEVGFRGAFTIDGVVTRGGFLPTELNPRMGAGLSTMLGGMPDLPVQLLLDAVVGGVDLELDPAIFETELLATADATRAGGTWRGSMSPALVEVENRPMCFVAGDWRWSADGEHADGWASSSLDSGNSGVRLMFNARGTPIGEPVGARAAAFWRFADEHLGTDCGPMTPAAVRHSG